MKDHVKEPVRLRKRPTKYGGASLYLEYVRNGERVYEFLKMYLVPERSRLDKTQNEETIRTAQAIKAQRIIELQNEAHGFSNSRTRGKVDLLRYIEAKSKDEGKNATHIHAALYHLKRFCPRIALRDVNKQFLRGFLHYLQTVKHTRTGRPLSKNTVYTTFWVVCSFLNKAVTDDLIPVNPLSKIPASERPQREPVARAYLTAAELKTLSGFPCVNDQVKRAFLFCCFCGLRFSDVYRLRWCDLQTLSDGTKQAEITQKKTGQPLYLPLSDNALKWMPKRNDAPDTAPVFGMPKYAMSNRHVREWCKKAGIKKRITFHCARHTNATLLLTYGADIYTVSKLLGHTNVKTTQVYAKVVDENKRRAVNLIPDISADKEKGGGQ